MPHRPSPLGVALSLVRDLDPHDGPSHAASSTQARWRLRALATSLIASVAGLFAGILPVAVGLGVEGLTRGQDGGASAAHGPSSAARLLVSLWPGGEPSPGVFVAAAFAGIVAAVAVSFFAGEAASKLTASTTAALRVAMMRAAIESSPHAIERAGASLGSPAAPPGLVAPSTARSGSEAVKLSVLRDAQGAAEFVVAALTTVPQAFFALLALGVDLARSGALAVVVGGAAIFALSRLFGARASRGVARATQVLQATDARVFSEVSEKLAHVEDFRLAGARGQAIGEVTEAAEASATARRGFARSLALSGQISGVLGAMAPLLVLLALGLSGRAPSAGDVAKLLLAVPIVVMRLQALDAFRLASIEKAPVLRAVRAVLDLSPHPDPARARLDAATLSGTDLELHHVSFRPEGAPHETVRDVSLVIPEGSVVGLCGASGSGKSTILRLLLRLEDPTSGEVTVGGTDLRELVPSGLPAVFAVLGQQTRLLGRTIEDNVTLGTGVHGDAEGTTRAIEALTAAQIGELAAPEGLARRFTAAPPNLSGGEQRRVLLARALARRTRVLVLDEPESGLPGAQAAAVIDAAVSAAKGRTVVVATHAPDLLRSTFNVLLDKGAIVARGTHAELLASNEAYARLFTRSEG